MHHMRSDCDPRKGKKRYSTRDMYILGPVLVPLFPKYVGEVRNQKAGTRVMSQKIIYAGRK